jgi:hypothetical protein
VVALNRFARDTGILSRAVVYEQVVAASLRDLWVGG